MRPASAARDRQSQSNLFRPDLLCLSVSICNLSAKIFDSENAQNVIFLVRFADFARTCAVIVNVPDLKVWDQCSFFYFVINPSTAVLYGVGGGNSGALLRVCRVR
eukprot:SAG25_NODE_2146_length_1897_cov_2.655172_1_plen_104_part_10